MTRESLLFRQTQRMTMAWVRGLALLLAALAWGTFGYWLVTGKAPGDNPPPPALLLVLLLLLGVGLPWFLLAIHLDVRLHADRLVVVLWPVWRRQIPLRDIVSAAPVTYRPLRDFLGWGVRWTPGHGWAMTVAGNRGVQLELTGGRRLLVGSEDPEPLAAAIRTALAGGRAG